MCFYHFHFLFDEVSESSRNQELMIRNCQWNCALAEEISIATEIGRCRIAYYQYFGKNAHYVSVIFWCSELYLNLNYLWRNAVRSYQKKLSLTKTKILKTTIFNKENIGKLERNKDSIKHQTLSQEFFGTREVS